MENQSSDRERRERKDGVVKMYSALQWWWMKNLTAHSAPVHGLKKLSVTKNCVTGEKSVLLSG